MLATCLGLMLAASIPAAAQPLIIGNNLDGTAEDTLDGPGGQAYQIGGAFQAPGNMWITELMAELGPMTGGHTKFAVYADNGDSANSLPSQFLTSTIEVTNIPAAGWYSIPLLSPLRLTADSIYWLVVWSNGVNDPKTQVTIFYVPGGPLRSRQVNYTGVWPDPINLGGNDPLTYCIYAEGKLGIDTVTTAGTDVTVTWSGGTPPYQLQTRTNLAAGVWTDLGASTLDNTATTPIINGPERYYRVKGQ